jgi:hypothetical protein
MKQQLLAILIAVVFLALLGTWLFRWEVIAVATNNVPMAYELDRWTGDVYMVGGGATTLQRKQ